MEVSTVEATLTSRSRPGRTSALRVAYGRVIPIRGPRPCIRGRDSRPPRCGLRGSPLALPKLSPARVLPFFVRVHVLAEPPFGIGPPLKVQPLQDRNSDVQELSRIPPETLLHAGRVPAQSPERGSGSPRRPPNVRSNRSACRRATSASRSVSRSLKCSSISPDARDAIARTRMPL